MNNEHKVRKKKRQTTPSLATTLLFIVSNSPFLLLRRSQKGSWVRGDETQGFLVSGKGSKCRHPPHISKEGWRWLLAHLQRRLSGIWPMVCFHRAVKATLVWYDTQFDTFPLRMAPWKPNHCCFDLYFSHPLQTEESILCVSCWSFFFFPVEGLEFIFAPTFQRVEGLRVLHVKPFRANYFCQLGLHKGNLTVLLIDSRSHFGNPSFGVPSSHTATRGCSYTCCSQLIGQENCHFYVSNALKH